MKNKRPIKIKCHGAYYYRTETQKGIKQYAIEVYAPSLEYFKEHTQKYVGTDDNGKQMFNEREFLNVRGRLKKRLLPALLQNKYPDFARVRYVVIDEIEGDNLEELPIQLKSKEQLRVIVQRAQMPINVDEYHDIDELRTDILEYQIEPKIWMHGKQRRDKRRQEEAEFMQLNNLAGEAISFGPDKPVQSIIEL